MASMSTVPQALPGGLLVVFDGIDGVGKTTQLELARDALVADNWQVHTTRNLGGTPIGEELRKVMLSPTERPSKTNLYISVAIQEALIGATELERLKGKIILMDRGPLSLAAYEIYGGGLKASVGWPYVEAGMKQFRPEVTIIYNADTVAAVERVKKKSGKTDYFESKSLNFFERVAQGYEIAAKRCQSPIVTIDANQPIEAVHKHTMSVIRQALSR